MTKDDALHRVEGYLTDYLPIDCVGEIDEIIEALSVDLCEDCISRKDLREPRFIIAENDYQKGWNDALDSVYENAPSVQPK